MKNIILSFLILLFTANTFVFAETLPNGIIRLDGREAPSLILNDMNGDPFDLSKLKGHWVFVHFWASWCGPCRKEMPTIQATLREYKDSRLKFAIVNTAETEDAVFSFLGSIASDIVPLMDNDGLVTERWQPRGLPSTFFVDPKGKLRYQALGGRAWSKDVYKKFLNQFK
jgi:thiol-disulfide isomerase/thioredoxin